LRQELGHSFYTPICPYEAAEALGVRVRFLAAPSMEGAYVPDLTAPTIVIGALRPAGRQRTTAAHELAHHIMGHGTRLDELADLRRGRSCEERLADVFAGAFLMPKIAIERALAQRKWDIRTLDPSHLYLLAGCFGVGYQTLICHLQWSLKLISPDMADRLACRPLPQIRETVLGRPWSRDVFGVDEHWAGRPLDLQVGDAVMVPRSMMAEGTSLSLLEEREQEAVIIAASPGRGKIVSEARSPAVDVRVSRWQYEGMYQFRYEPEVDDEDNATTTAD